MRRLRVALILNLIFVAVEVAAGFAFSSLALLADAVHNAGDAVAIVVATIAARVARTPRSARHSYGLGRAEVLAALANSALALVITGAIAIESVRRLFAPADAEGAGIAIVGAIGIAINGFAAWLLWERHDGHAHHRDLNRRAAFLHAASDAGGSAAAALAGVAVVVFDAPAIDAVGSLAIGVLVVGAAWRLLIATARVLLEGTPIGIDPHAVETAIANIAGVAGVHHLHVWAVSSKLTALSVHLVADAGLTLHDAELLSSDVKVFVGDRFGIDHATVEVECHDCEVTVPFRTR